VVIPFRHEHTFSPLNRLIRPAQPNREPIADETVLCELALYGARTLIKTKMEISARARLAFRLAIAALGVQSAGCKDTGLGPQQSSTVSIGVTVAGVDTDEHFVVSLDNGPGQDLSPSTPLVVRYLASGQHTVSLGDVGQNCAVAGANPVTVDAPAGDIKSIGFLVTCTATTGIIAVTVPVTGASEPVSFSIQVDAELPVLVLGNQKTIVGKFIGGQHSVHLLGLPASCTVNDGFERSLLISTGGITQDTVLAKFDVACDPNVERNPNAAVAIAFQRGGSVAVMDEDGSNVRVLTSGLGASFSPHGDFIAFWRTLCTGNDCSDWSAAERNSWCNWNGCTHYVWTIRTDGSGEKKISPQAGFYDTYPAVSPAGDRIAFFEEAYDQTYLVMTDVSGGSLRILASWDPLASKPAWSPDGSQIAFTCEPKAGGWDLCVVPTQPGCTTYFYGEHDCKLAATAPHLTTTRAYESDPAWSPDGGVIAFTLQCLESAGCPPGILDHGVHVALLDLATRTVTPLIEGSHPAWSPDGGRIVFDSPDGTGLSIINRDGTGLRKLTTDPRDHGASWGLR
jgi:Tol biopolymer transport system component